MWWKLHGNAFATVATYAQVVNKLKRLYLGASGMYFSFLWPEVWLVLKRFGFISQRKNILTHKPWYLRYALPYRTYIFNFTLVKLLLQWCRQSWNLKCFRLTDKANGGSYHTSLLFPISPISCHDSAQLTGCTVLNTVIIGLLPTASFTNFYEVYIYIYIYVCVCVCVCVCLCVCLGLYICSQVCQYSRSTATEAPVKFNKMQKFLQ